MQIRKLHEYYLDTLFEHCLVDDQKRDHPPKTLKISSNQKVEMQLPYIRTRGKNTMVASFPVRKKKKKKKELL